MSYELTQIQKDHVQYLRDQGDYHLAYRYLSEQMQTAVDNGDPYAQAAADLTADDTSLLGHVVQRYWDNVLGEGVREEKWDDVAKRHLENYIQEIQQFNYNLPDSKFIEESYSEALEFNGLSKNGAIDLAINQATQPLSIDVDDYLDIFLPYYVPDQINDPISNFVNDLPDWHNVLGLLYGGFGDRGVQNSDNFSDAEWHKAMFDLGLAGLQGTMDYFNDLVFDDMPDALREQIQRFNPNVLFDLAKDYDWAFDNKEAVLDELKGVLDGAADDYGWAWDNPGAIGRELLPEWLSDKVIPQTITARKEASPLVIDLDGDGIELTALNGGSVFWDIDQDGMAEASASASPDDGLLAANDNAFRLKSVAA